MQPSASSLDATNTNIVSQTQPIGSTVRENANGLAAAIARSLARGAAVYFSRPVRLFRPTKVSGWTSLRGAALRDGASLTPKYILNLIKSEGFVVLPRHFVPPLVVNTLLGTVLWSSYSYSSTYLESVIPTHPVIVAAASGAIAGATQALAAAPAENVRLVLEGVEGAGPVKTLLGQAPNSNASAGWTNAWKEVFRGRDPIIHAHSREEVRAIAQWVKEVRGVAGRGWDGWGWGVGKDSAGFALFFSIFELSRKLANDASGRVVSEFERWHIRLDKDATPMTEKAKKTAARTVHGVTLVAGGVVAGLGYEMVCRPFDNTRKLVYLDDQHKKAESIASHINKPPRLEARIHVVGRVVLAKMNEDGPASFFRNPQPTVHAPTGPNTWLYAGLRTLSRLGPWGVGFLVWEFMGGGLPQI